MLGRLGIRQKLTLLLLIPLAAMLITLIPLAVDRIGEGQSAEATARSAEGAREIGALIQEIQQERLLAIGYLISDQLDRSALLSQAQTTSELSEQLAAGEYTGPVIERAKVPLATLVVTRQRVSTRAATVSEAFADYRVAVIALLDALDLLNPATVTVAGVRADTDADGIRQLDALDELLHANEEASSAGAVLVAMTGGSTLDPILLSRARLAQEEHTRRFRLLVTPAQSDLLALVELGRAGQRLEGLMDAATATAAPTANAGSAVREAATVNALTAAISYTDLRRVAQDRIAREIATSAQGRADDRTTAAGIAVGASLLLLILVVVLGVAVGRAIAGPLRRLTTAAGRVAELAGAELARVGDDEDEKPRPARLAAVEVRSTDEIGALANAFNRVQATAALLVERQVSARRNVSIMFSNIARRTQNLVGRQLALVDTLDRQEYRPDARDRIGRLDHLATRLRRSADSLLVLAGSTDEDVTGTPTLLVDVLRTALDEIEDSSHVHLVDILNLAVAPGFVTDLRLLLAELLDNAVNFSPPGSRVEVRAILEEGCRITIADHGLGLSQERLAEENRRLVERERLDVVPSSVLGLFVVGRIARRHGLSVTLFPTLGGKGVTADVHVPMRLLAHPSAIQVGPAPVPVRRRRPRLAIGDGTFAWFGSDLPAIEAPSYEAPPAIEAPPAAAVGRAIVTSPSPSDSGTSGVEPAEATPRQVAAEPMTAPPAWPPTAPEQAPLHRPQETDRPRPQETDRSRPQGTVGEPEVERGGLKRRIPGARLAATTPGGERSQRSRPGGPGTGPVPAQRGPAGRQPGGTPMGDDSDTEPLPRPGTAARDAAAQRARDAAAERDGLNDFLSGFARAVDPPPVAGPPGTPGGAVGPQATADEPDEPTYEILSERRQ